LSKNRKKKNKITEHPPAETGHDSRAQDRSVPGQSNAQAPDGISGPWGTVE
jgi:hypothetical protein